MVDFDDSDSVSAASDDEKTIERNVSPDNLL